MAGESAVDRAAMAQAGAQVEDALGQVRSQQSTLNGYHGELMGGWAGEAATAFTNAFNAFNADFTKVIQALQGIQEKLVTTRGKYQANEEVQTAAANRVQGLLNH
jgi:WXG100 family type VII secretion target